ncbi:MAG: hypothetical protein R2827_11680 [Bdellovibrionales bacterium]
MRFILAILAVFFLVQCGQKDTERTKFNKVTKQKPRTPCAGLCKPDPGDQFVLTLDSRSKKVDKNNSILQYRFLSSDPQQLKDTDLYYQFEVYPLSYQQWSRVNGPCKKRPCGKSDHYIFYYTLVKKTGPNEYQWQSSQSLSGTLSQTGIAYVLVDLGNMATVAYNEIEVQTDLHFDKKVIGDMKLPAGSATLKYRWHDWIPSEVKKHLRP